MSGAEIAGLILIIVGVVLFIAVFIAERLRPARGVAPASDNPIVALINWLRELLEKAGNAYIPPVILIVLGILLFALVGGDGGDNPGPRTSPSPTPAATATP